VKTAPVQRAQDVLDLTSALPARCPAWRFRAQGLLDLILVDACALECRPQPEEPVMTLFPWREAPVLNGLGNASLTTGSPALRSLSIQSIAKCL
jgi:hypothetical protein